MFCRRLPFETRWTGKGSCRSSQSSHSYTARGSLCVSAKIAQSTGSTSPAAIMRASVEDCTPAPRESTRSGTSSDGVLVVIGSVRVTGEADEIAAFPFADVAHHVVLRLQAEAAVLAAIVVAEAFPAAIPALDVGDVVAAEAADGEPIFWLRDLICSRRCGLGMLTCHGRSSSFAISARTNSSGTPARSAMNCGLLRKSGFLAHRRAL